MARIIAICLVISNIVVGTAGYFILREMNQRYATLVQSSLPALNTVRSLSWETSRVQRVINRLRDTPLELRPEAMERQLVSRADCESLLTQVLAIPASMISKSEKEQLRLAHGGYATSVSEWRGLVEEGRIDEAYAMVVTRVRPAYDRIENQLDTLADDIHEQGISGTTRLSAEAGLLGGGLVLMAAWPLWLGGLALMFVALSIVTLGMILKWTSPKPFF